MTIQSSEATHLFICLVCFVSGWACQQATTHRHTHIDDYILTHTRSELPTTVLIAKTVCQSSGEIKGKKEWGGGVGGLNVILNDLRFTDSNVLACLLSSGTERKQSASVKREH